MKVMKINIKNIRIETAINVPNDKIIPEKISHIIAPSQEKILFFDKSSAYSDGSALFIIYESEVTSLNSLMIPYKITAIKRRRIFIHELRNCFKRSVERSDHVTSISHFERKIK